MKTLTQAEAEAMPTGELDYIAYASTMWPEAEYTEEACQLAGGESHHRGMTYQYESADHPFEPDDSHPEDVCRRCRVSKGSHHERPAEPPPRGREVLCFRPERADLNAAVDANISEEYSVTVDVSRDLPESGNCIVWGWIRGEWHPNANARPVVIELLRRLGEVEESPQTYRMRWTEDGKGERVSGAMTFAQRGDLVSFFGSLEEVTHIYLEEFVGGKWKPETVLARRIKAGP